MFYRKLLADVRVKQGHHQIVLLTAIQRLNAEPVARILAATRKFADKGVGGREVRPALRRLERHRARLRNVLRGHLAGLCRNRHVECAVKAHQAVRLVVPNEWQFVERAGLEAGRIERLELWHRRLRRIRHLKGHLGHEPGGLPGYALVLRSPVAHGLRDLIIDRAERTGLGRNAAQEKPVRLVPGGPDAARQRAGELGERQCPLECARLDVIQRTRIGELRHLADI